MADQIPIIKSKRLKLQLKPPLFCFQALMMGLCVLALSICSVQTARCPSSVPSSAGIITEQYNFSEYGYTNTYGIVGGPVSNSLYYLYILSTPSSAAAVRKVDASGSQTWVTSALFQPITKSLSVDAAEQSVYLASYENPLVVLKLAASDGSIVTQHQFTGINGINRDIKTWPLTDLSGYFVIGRDSSNIAKICKYTFSYSSAQCQTISNIVYGYGPLMISNNQFFVLDASLVSPNNLLMYKLTFSSISVNWANQMTCTSGTCTAYFSESVMSSDGSTVYSFFLFGSPYYLYFVGLSVSNGSVVTTRYKSSTTVTSIWGSALNGDYVVAITQSPSFSFMMYRISSSTFSVNSFSSGNLYGCGVEPSSGRFVVTGVMNSKGYTTKFVPQSISLNLDFSPGSYSMTALSLGTDDIVAQSGITIAAADASFTPAAGSYANQTATYNLISPFVTLDSYLQIATQTYSVSESTTNTQTPNLSCSFLGSTSIIYSLSGYNGGIVPSFVSIDSTTGVLTIAAPSVSSSTTYSFYIDSTISGISEPVQKIINLTINKCKASNCKICTVTDSSVCATCNPGFSLSSGSYNLCESKMSNLAKSLSAIVQAIIGVIVLISVGSCLADLSSMASLWSVISQLQILFLLFLTGAFIPNDIEGIITGLTIGLNPFSFLQQKLNGDYNFVSNYFDFGLENSNLEKFGIKSDSTIVNMTSFLLSIIIFCILHLCIFLTQKLLSKESKLNCCSKVLFNIHWILQKLMVFFTFALYIRTILQINQFILISCVSEVYQFNVSGVKRIISTTIAFLVLISCIIIIVITLLHTLSKDADKSSESPDKRDKFANLFDGVSPNKKSRMFVCLLQIRCAVFVILLITVGPKSSITVISLLVGLQLIYLVILVVIRPYNEISFNMIEITNELYFLVFLVSLIKYNTSADWEGTPTTAYTWLISINPFVSLLVIFVDRSCKIVIKCRNKYCKKGSESIQGINAQPIVASRIDNSANNIDQSNDQMNKKNLTDNIQFGSGVTRHRVGNRVYVKR